MPLDLIESDWICLGSVRAEPRRNPPEILWEPLVTWFVHEALYARRGGFLTGDANKTPTEVVFSPDRLRALGKRPQACAGCPGPGQVVVCER